MDMEKVEIVQNLNVYQCIVNNGVRQFPFTVNLDTMNFIADYVIVNSITTSFAAGDGNDATFIVHSNLSGNSQALASFQGTVSTFQNLNTIIKLGRQVPNIRIDILQVQTDNTLATPVLTGDWYMNIGLTFVKHKSSK